MEKIQIKVEIKNSLEIFLAMKSGTKFPTKLTEWINLSCQSNITISQSKTAQTLPIDDHFDNFNSMKNMWHGMCSSDSVLIEKISLFLSLEYFST